MRLKEENRMPNTSNPNPSHAPKSTEEGDKAASKNQPGQSQPSPNQPAQGQPQGQHEGHAHKDHPRHSGKGGPNNPLPGEPGGPSTAGFTPEDRKASEDAQRRASGDDKAHDDKPKR
jgi:hypothetical protein